MTSHRRPVALALGAALLFGLSTPAAKILVAGVDPWMLAGLLYLGSGLGLGLLLCIRRAAGRRRAEAALGRADLPWLTVAIVTGGGLGPVLLMTGLAATFASQAALLLNLEGVFTALFAWFVFSEHFDARIAVGMALITLGALALAWQGTDRLALDRGAILVAAACIAWALDNNVTRHVSAADPVVIAALKGTAAGTANIVIAMARGAPLPGPALAFGAGAVGLLGYGISLVLFVLALRHLGAGRTGAYFSIAPFIGAVAAVIQLDETVTAQLVVAGVLMGLGVWLHLSERHEHEHTHEPVEHDHRHWHDEHHRHEHAPGAPLGEPHSHPHAHAGLRHSHPHYPDLHHRHEHH